MKNDKNLKPLVFYSSFEEQTQYSLCASVKMTYTERLAEMYRLNRKIYGEKYGKVSRKTELYVGLPGESVNDFYRRIDKDYSGPTPQKKAK